MEILTLALLLPVLSLAYRNPSLGQRKCERITIPMCKGIGYNMTSMPNQFNHLKQEEAGLEVHQFWPLVGVKCSPYLKFFLCSMYTPICLSDFENPLPPCRSVCEHSRQGCAPLMQRYGFQWPKNLDCSKLPESPTGGVSDPDNLCMEPPNAKDLKQTSVPPAVEFPTGPRDFTPGPFPPVRSSTPHEFDPESPSCECICHRPFVTIKEEEKYKHLTVGNVSSCAYPCFSPYLDENQKRQDFMTLWISIWSIPCCLITFITVLTFMVDVNRFQYPERPIFFLAFCYFMVSIGFIIRLIAGHKRVACDGNIVRAGQSDPATCTIVFLLIYFFGMASSVWWVVLSLTWFLAAGLKWSNEAICSYAGYFHLFAWAFPAVKTLLIFILTAVDGDPVAGVCYVGNTNINHLRAFVLGPLVAYLLLGCCFLVAGFVSLIRIHNVVKAQQGHSKIEKLEQLMVKIGIFSVLYTIPAAFVIGCLFYEQHYRQLWELGVTCQCAPALNPNQTVFVLALIKYSMSLVVGVTSGLWIWSGKTVLSWRRWCAALCRHPPTGPAAYHQAEAIIIKSHTDVSSQAYSTSVRHPYPMNHV